MLNHDIIVIYFIEKFLTDDDIAKINRLSNLIELNLDQNPLGKIPAFNHTNLQSLSLRDSLITSTQFPSSYNNCQLQKIALSDNKIRAINEHDFAMLSNSKLDRLELDSGSISKIDRNAFGILKNLQSLSLKQNQLKSAEFLLNIPKLSSIKLDGNQFTSLPSQLSVQGNIKIYSFIHNSITTIDESSPLNTWLLKNWTNNKIYLVNNPIDCCLSLWFIGFLKKASQFVEDSSILTCAAPSNLVGQFLMNLNPDDVDCGGDKPHTSWWTTGRILGILIGCISLIVIILIILYRCFRHRPLRSGYSEIGDPYVNIDSSLPGGPVFPDLNDDNYDHLSTYTYPDGTQSYVPSHTQTHSTAEGIYPADASQEGDSVTENTALLHPTH